MLILDDDCDVSIIYSHKPICNTVTIYDCMQVGDPIYYDNTEKIFTPVYKGTNQAFIGYFIYYNKVSNIITVMYRDFLINNILQIPGTIKEFYIQNYLKKTFEIYKNSIIKNMPRIKRLKRIKLQMFNKTAALLMHDNIDNIIKTYEEAFGKEKANEFKARIVTTPIYISDNNIIKTYDFAMNELKIPDIEAEGNFLCFFLYQDRRICN
ncbi:MAG: hypothetical protein [Wendovervirus sonii]|uniref:Uncharacterized protein n=1 Tax=phage Lak_Megaphage_Sonny TaxID=3109229 RepID=A0ABZ0Z343_9CAUD|nr:MAG: hypothetical protein [phage Lak_Megaphage_Sonny]